MFKYSGENLPNSLCHFLNHKSVFLQILDHLSVSWKITPLYLFSSNVINVGQEEPIKLRIFETLMYSGQNLSILSCQFWNDTSIPLQIFYHSPVSIHIYILCKFVARAFSTLDKRIPSKTLFWDFRVLWWKVTMVLMSLSKPQVP